MIRMASALLIGLAAAVAFADAEVSAVQKEIDRAVWKTFHDAFERMDGRALNSVYADNVLRVTPDGIDTQGAFKRFNEDRFKRNLANGDQIALDFWFDSRHTNETTSYDVGFFRVGITAPEGATSYFYGQFHIVLQKIEGQWKIVQDWDTDAIGGRPITATDFDRQLPVQF